MIEQIRKYILSDVEPLREDDTVYHGSTRLSKEHLTDLPVVNDEGLIVGIFGEKEVIGSLFPTYLGELSDTSFVRMDFEDITGDVRKVMNRPVADFLRKKYCALNEDFSTMHCAELFLHKRQGVIPIVSDGKPVALIRRSDLGRAIFEAVDDGQV